MKVIIKFPIYVVADFSENVPRNLVSGKIQEFFQDHLSVETTKSSIEKRRFMKELEEKFGSEVSMKIITERQLLKKLLTEK